MLNNDLLRYKTLIQNLHDAILVEDENRDISLVNQAFCDLFEIPVDPALLVGSNCSSSAEQSKHLFLKPDEFVESVEMTLENREPVYDVYFELKNGRKLERDYIPIFDAEVYLGHLWVYKDLTRHYELQEQLETAQKSLSKLAQTDPLTGLGNRRYLLESVQKEIEFSRKNQQPLSVCMIDLDDFKQINDRLGHDKGDSVLKGFSEFLLEQSREADILARFGGEEFVVLMPDMTASKAKNFVANILKQLNLIEISDQKLSFSAGIAELCSDCTEESFLSLADKAMYQVKHNGKNRVGCI